MKFNFFNPQVTDNPVSSLTMLIIGVIILSLQDSLIKYMAGETSFWQLQFIRSIGNIILLFGIARITNGIDILFPLKWKPVYLRALTMTTCMFCFFAASPQLSFAQMAAGLYTFPIFVSLLAIVFLKERIGLWRFFALILGSFGALLILEPWSENFKFLQILPVMAGFFFACNIILIRKYCRQESVMSLTLAVGVMFFISASLGILFFELIFQNNFLRGNSPFVFIGWPSLTLIVFVFCLSCSILNISGNILLAKAYQTAESSWLAPMDYSYLVFAAIWGKIFFGVWPTLLNLIGMFFIAFSGILIAFREQRKLKSN
ncbi:DMT family transporter [Alphaproteobacteria bacterium]|nr:DMT family transporter [Alphaproteobacteria bacterium]